MNQLYLERSFDAPRSANATSQAPQIQITERSAQQSSTFRDSVEQVKALVCAEFEREIIQKRLYYHNFEHVTTVVQRSQRILRTLQSHWTEMRTLVGGIEFDRFCCLLELCAIAHDMVQIFQPQTAPHTPRRRETGVSETATIDRLLQWIESLNQEIVSQFVTNPQPDHTALFQAIEMEMLREAIQATICFFDPVDQAIYQPKLYESDRPLCLMTYLIALADIGSLGMEGIESYNREGSLVFMEENLDLLPFLEQYRRSPAQVNPEQAESLRQRLLRRAKFQVDFAKSRFVRLPQELAAFPAAIAIHLQQQVFANLTPQTIRLLEDQTPTAEDTSLEVLLDFFAFDALQPFAIRLISAAIDNPLKTTRP